MIVEEKRQAQAAAADRSRADASPLAAIRADLRRCLRAASAELRREQTRKRMRRHRQRQKTIEKPAEVVTQ